MSGAARGVVQAASGDAQAANGDARSERLSAAARRLARSPLFWVQLALFGAAAWLRFHRLDADLPALQNADDLGDEGYWFIGARDLLRFGQLDPGSNFFQALAGAPLTLGALAGLARLSGGIDYPLVRGFTAACSLLLLALCTLWLRRKNAAAATLFLALYGLFPLFVFYSRLAFVEPHALLWLSAGMIALEAASRPRGFLLAGFCLSLALAAKLVAAFALPGALLFLLLRRRAARPLLWAALGAAPVCALLALHLWVHRVEFAPTFTALASYHAHAGFFIDRSSLGYFWLRPLTLPLLPWLLAGPGLWLARRRLSWPLCQAASVLLCLSLFRYQSVARHLLLVFPLTLLAAEEAGRLLGEAGPRLRVALGVLCGALLLPGAAATLLLGRFGEPQTSYRDAARTLAAITGPDDRVAGVHAYGLSLPGLYRPRMSLNATAWAGVDPLSRAQLTLALVPEVFNGVPGAGRVFPRREQFGAVEPLDTLQYLGRFRTNVLRVFESEDERQLFLRFRQGRPSRYDSLLDHRYRAHPEAGCRVKALQVAESRGDAEISHRKISRTGCLGMFGFCGPTARSFPDLFPRLGPALRPGPQPEEAFLADDRFDPLRSMLGAERLLLGLSARFAGLRERDRLAFAAYNAGGTFVAELVRLSGKADPDWERDLLPILRDPGFSGAPGYSRASEAERRHKFGYELPHYVDDAWQTMQACLERRRLLIPNLAAPVPAP